jgi:2'-5' RNA ligase
MNAPIIVSAMFGAEDARWMNGLRRAHFPPDRNVLPAHLTLFHHLPPSIEHELDRRLAEATKSRPPRATASGLINLGRGVAIRIDAPDLEEIRGELADAFRHNLMPQDAAGWRPHVTVQNKVQPAQARALYEDLTRSFRTCPVAITGLASWWYRGGPWELIKSHAFR